MAAFLHALPEQAENPLPPLLPGESAIPTKLHTLRLRQLQDLAKAYGIDLPDGATKNEILPIMASHENSGLFRTPPQSQYHRIHAELNHDEKIDPRTKADREVRMARALERETKNAEDQDQPTINDLRSRCKELGLNSYGKTVEQLKEMIEGHREG